MRLRNQWENKNILLNSCRISHFLLFIDERLPGEYKKYLVDLTSILREVWNTAANAENEREKIQALSLAKECYAMKLLTSATVVDDDAMRFITGKSKDDQCLKNQEADQEIQEIQQSKNLIF